MPGVGLRDPINQRLADMERGMLRSINWTNTKKIEKVRDKIITVLQIYHQRILDKSLSTHVLTKKNASLSITDENGTIPKIVPASRKCAHCAQDHFSGFYYRFEDDLGAIQFGMHGLLSSCNFTLKGQPLARLDAILTDLLSEDNSFG